MLLGALLDAGAPGDWLTGLPARLGIPEVTVEFEVVLRCSIRCRKVTVSLPGGRVEQPADVGHHCVDIIGSTISPPRWVRGMVVRYGSVLITRPAFFISFHKFSRATSLS